MANKVLVAANTTPLIWGDESTYTGPGSITSGIDLTSLVIDAARQGSKDDIAEGGVANRFARWYEVTMRIEFLDADPAGPVELYWASSPSLTAATANPGGTTGSDSAYSGTAGSTLDESIQQLGFLGSLLATKDGTTVVQIQSFRVELPLQFGFPVVYNRTDSDFVADAVEMSITFTPLELEVQ